MEEIRCFVAIELPREVKSGLSRIQAKLKSVEDFPVKWVDPDSIHLTLKFLGNVKPEMTTQITELVREASLGFSPFQLEIKGLGVFPNPRRVQVIWVGVSGDVEKLLKLQKAVESNLTRLGFVPEARAFTPHLTLGRVRERASSAERERLGELVAKTNFEAGGAFLVSSISLMRSQLTREGPIYSQISSVQLGTCQ